MLEPHVMIAAFHGHFVQVGDAGRGPPVESCLGHVAQGSLD